MASLTSDISADVIPASLRRPEGRFPRGSNMTSEGWTRGDTGKSYNDANWSEHRIRKTGGRRQVATIIETAHFRSLCGL